MGMKRVKTLLIAAAVLCLLFLSGCVVISEEINVFEDGSGTLRFAIGVKQENYENFQEALPEGYALENYFATLTQDEVLTSMQVNHYTQDGLDWESVEFELADFVALFSQKRRIGPVEITFDEREEGFRFTQTIDMANSNLVIPGVHLMDLSALEFTVDLKTPQIINTNGVQSAAGVSTWSIPMGEVLQDGSTAFLRADYILEPYEGIFIPWEVFFPYLVVGFLALCGLAILAVIFVNTVIKREKAPTLKFK